MAVCEHNEAQVVVGITYSTGRKPPPYRFFRVSREGSVSECPREFWPLGWNGPYL